MLTHLTELIRGGWRYGRGLQGFFSKTIDYEEARAMLTAQLENRNERFLRILELAIYAFPDNPYRRLLLHAGFQLQDVRRLIEGEGLEAALSQLHDAGVYVTLEEFKGRTPVRRPGLEFPVTARDFDNPLLTSHFEGATSGTRGDPTRVHIDLDYIAYESACFMQHFAANGVADRPIAIWAATESPMLALGNTLRLVRIDRMPRTWFSPMRSSWSRQAIQGRAMLIYTLLASRLFRRPIPWPKYRPEPKDFAAYVADARRKGEKMLVICSQSRSIRICLAAEQAGLDISGTVFFCGGEPYTEGKAAVFKRVGADCIPHYAMHETGSVAYRCGHPVESDDMHVSMDKLAVLPRPKQLETGPTVQAFFHTSLLPSLPKLMLNVESGDYGQIDERDCGCEWQTLGFTTHLSQVRSYEKLTSEGVTFMGSMLHELLEQVLPNRFGGSPLDYQMVEEEEDGVPKVSVIVSPRIGPVDDKDVVDAVINALSFSEWSKRMAETWRKEGTLRVLRQDPYVSAIGKMLPLHVLGAQKSHV
jgi:phenylacetate-coenzyme A ligase PaaK-like adenylate-forming protein